MLFKLKPKKILNTDNFISGLFFGLIFIGTILNTLANKTYSEDSWTVGEWLINYQGGFVRRGFLGELIFLFSTSLKVSPIYLIWFICILSYFFLIFESLKAAKDKVSYIFLLSPSIFLAPLVGNFLIRKDIILLLLFLINLKILKAKTPNMLLFQVINIFSILIHEVFAIYALPIQILLVFKIFQNRKKIIITNFLLPILTFLLCLIFKGDYSQAIVIHNSWLSKEFLFPFENLNYQFPMGAINAIGLDINHVILLLKSALSDFKGIIWVPLSWLLTVILLAGLFLGDNSSKDFKIKGFILLFQFIPFTILCLSGWDYGRWIFIWIVSSILVYCIFRNELRSIEFNNFLFTALPKIEFNHSSKFLLILFLYPHCCWSLYYLPSLLILSIYALLQSRNLFN